jgi:Nif-specific regulatory protein
MKRESVDIATLVEVSGVLGSTLDLREVFDQVMRVLEARLNILRGRLVILDEAASKLRVEAALGLSADEQRRGIYTVGEGVTGQVVATGQPRVVPDVSKEPGFLFRTAKLDDRETRCFMCHPIKLGNRVLGALSVDKHFVDDETLERDNRLLQIVTASIAQALQVNRLIAREKRDLFPTLVHHDEQVIEEYQFQNIVGSSRAMLEVFNVVRLVAKTPATVLLTGETGTGKELIARAIHLESERYDRPFIRLNCGALAGTLLESELFGHVKGAFTGAIRDKVGRFEAAEGGTLFLDEVSTLEKQLQVKLLRVLQEREFERVGDAQTIPADVRIIAATNDDLEKEVEEGTFREDLFYRLNVVSFPLPPLRDRREDIPRLINHFLDKFNQANGRNLTKLSQEVLDLMMRYPWPGNVRELENAIERAVVLSQGQELTLDLLPQSTRAFAREGHARISRDTPETLAQRLAEQVCEQRKFGHNGDPWQKAMSELERSLIRSALNQCDNVKIKAADFLGINRNTLNKKFRDLGLEDN